MQGEVASNKLFTFLMVDGYMHRVGVFEFTKFMTMAGPVDTCKVLWSPVLYITICCTIRMYGFKSRNLVEECWFTNSGRDIEKAQACIGVQWSPVQPHASQIWN